MPFVKVSRDKRGYEQISLMHVSTRRGRPSKQRVLYVFRTPPGVKIGREPFDTAVQREIEAHNPGVVFDWKALSNIPVPAPDVEYWRERRKVDKAAKLARKAEEQVDAAETLEAVEPHVPPVDASELVDAFEEVTAVSEVPSGLAILYQEAAEEGDETVRPEPGTAILAPGTVGVEGWPPEQPRHQRRRRHRHRHRGAPPGLAAATQPDESQGDPSLPAEAPAAGTPIEAGSSPELPGDPSKLAPDTSKEA